MFRKEGFSYIPEISPEPRDKYYSQEKYRPNYFDDLREVGSIRIDIPSVQRIQENSRIDGDYQYVDNEYSQKLKNQFNYEGDKFSPYKPKSELQYQFSNEIVNIRVYDK